MFDPEKFGEAMGLAIKEATAPLLERIKQLEDKLKEPIPIYDAIRAEVSKEVGAITVKHGLDGNPGKDGENGLGLAGAMIDRDGALLVTLTNGEVKSLGKVVGKDGSDGKDGLSLEDFQLEYLPESHEINVKAVCNGRTKELRYPAGGIRPAGYWRDGTKAVPGEAWVHGGSLWICMKGTEAKPATNADAWIIAARAGRDGERGATGKLPNDAPIKLVN
jgi:hypothetical protein